ncbi:MAG TPA: MerR family transcriptional regulator [Solirubrobacteraceae bacterium]|jgi:DNA-binding transcriptional MerR regulator|nr:MerR family transcriptional regulator [Solirubrobacteraceae bacterium]
MDDGTTRITIGELARRSGVAVRTLRFYADRGLVTPAARTDAGYRLYDPGAVAQVALVRTLRDLGVGLPTIRRVLDRELDLAGVAAAHACALDAQIRVLRLSRSVARLAARREATPQEMTLMHDLARLSQTERRRIVDDFLDDVLGGLDIEPDLAARMRMARPDLPDDPSVEQVEAWIELAELVADPDFRRRIRAMSERGAADRAGSPDAGERARAGAALAPVVAERAGAALAAGIDPSCPAAAAVVDEIVAAFAAVHGRADDGAYREWLLGLLDTFTDARAERYWQLLAVINGWPARAATVPAWEWFGDALRATA